LTYFTSFFACFNTNKTCFASRGTSSKGIFCALFDAVELFLYFGLTIVEDVFDLFCCCSSSTSCSDSEESESEELDKSSF